MRVLFAFLTIVICSAMIAQTAGGHAFRIDYEEFLDNGLEVKHFNCGNNDMLNTGDEMTIMVWVKLRTTLDDQKVVGKYDLNESGFSFGVINGEFYPAIWNPTPYLVQDGILTGNDRYWYHLAMTYLAGDYLRSFVNGEEVGQYELADLPIAPNEDDLIIGVSSWASTDAFQMFGNMDELGI